MKSDTLELNVLIFVTCEHETFKQRYAISIKQWLSKAAETFDKKPVLKFTEVNIITSGIPKLDEIKKHHGIVISGSFSRTGENKPWMEKLRHTIRLCYVNQIPIFGICFGFQILSQAFGSTCVPSPHGFNFGGFLYKLNDKALPFFRHFIEDFYNDDKAYSLFDSDSDPDTPNHNHHTPNQSSTNGFTNNKDSLNNHSNGTNGHINDIPASEKLAPCTFFAPNYSSVLKHSMDSMLGSFSHNDIVTSFPNIDNIDFGDLSYTDRTELYESLSDLVPITISSLPKVPFVGLLIGNKSKTFMAAVQLHPEFDTVTGKKFCKEILNLKLNQGVITVQKYEENLQFLKFSNSGYVYGKMALSLFMNGHLNPIY